MRVTDVFEGVEYTLWAQLAVGPVARVDSGRRGADLVVEVELTPGVDPGEILVLREERTLTLVNAFDRAVLHRIPLDTAVGRPVRRDLPGRLLLTAPLAGPAPVWVTPGVRSRAGRLRAALTRLYDRFRGLFRA
ncbi:MAG TPA: hypothetical protein K8V84_09170 [Nocardiopsis listeri]|uniref:hypothetical protein n=1 Tax=Nocardiopsis listeri TaxID=53440 RepID=UPI001D4B9E7F|nr:hypothetical protein [Nocardiopsis listeri]HJE58666.1 hypothetical protein [Nocardiopsis listeri]